MLTRSCSIVAVSLFVIGCGDSLSNGNKAVVTSNFLYFDKADLETGGGAGKPDSLVANGKGMRIVYSLLCEVLDTEGKAVKVRLIQGYKSGSTGWVSRSDIHAVTGEELANHERAIEDDKAQKVLQDREVRASMTKEAAVRHAKELLDELKDLDRNAKEAVAEKKFYLARKYYEDLVKKFPGTPQSVAAEKMLSDLPLE